MPLEEKRALTDSSENTPMKQGDVVLKSGGPISCVFQVKSGIKFSHLDFS
jgi:hypothetical protein